MCSIQPANGGRRFTREANHALLEMVVDRDLIGVVQRIDAQVDFLHTGVGLPSSLQNAEN